MQQRSTANVAVVAFGLMVCVCHATSLVRQAVAYEPPLGQQLDRSPVDLVLTPDEDWLLTANQTSGTVSLVHVQDGTAVAEVPCGERPSAIALVPDGRRVLVSATYSGELRVFERAGDSLTPAGTVRLGFEPRGIAIAPDGHLAYVALTAANEVAVSTWKSCR